MRTIIIRTNDGLKNGCLLLKEISEASTEIGSLQSNYTRIVQLGVITTHPNNTTRRNYQLMLQSQGWL